MFDLLLQQGEKLTALIKPARDVLSLRVHAIVLGRASRPGEEGPWRGDHSAGPGRTLPVDTETRPGSSISLALASRGPSDRLQARVDGGGGRMRVAEEQGISQGSRPSRSAGS